VGPQHGSSGGIESSLAAPTTLGKGSAGGGSASSADDVKPLQFWECAGVIVLSLMATTAGLLLNVLWRCAPSQRAARREWNKIMHTTGAIGGAARATAAGGVSLSSTCTHAPATAGCDGTAPSDSASAASSSSVAEWA